MAYNYYPATYQNPYYVQYPQTQNVQQTGIIWVTSEAEAQSYPVAPNNAVALWDSSKPAVYIKQADASGKPIMKVYDLAERSELAQIKQNDQGYKLTDFALKSEIEPILNELDTIKADIKMLKRKRRDIDDE